MKRSIVFFLIAASLASCSENKKQTKEEMVSDFKTYEDSLFNEQHAGLATKNQKEANMEYAERCLTIAHKFPKDQAAAAYMDKAHMTFAGMQLYGRSVAIADSIIVFYPRYKNRAMVLESAASTYDMFILPRNKEKIKKYYELLLEENPKMPKEQRDQLKFRLEHIDLSYNEMIGLQQTNP